MKQNPNRRCPYCGEPIELGECCYVFEDTYYHEDCFQDAAPDILREMGAQETMFPSDEEIAGDLECDRRREERLMQGDNF